MRSVFFILLIPLVLVAGLSAAETPQRSKQIDLVHNWNNDPNNQNFLQLPYLSGATEALREKNITLWVTDLQGEKNRSNLSYVVFWNWPHSLKKSALDSFPKKKLLLFIWEPPVVLKHLYRRSFLDRFHRVYTWDDDLVDNKKFFKFYYPVLRPMENEIPPFENRKLVTQISTNRKSKHSKELYTEREKVIQFFENKPAGDFEFYGHAWEKKGYKNYKGTVDDKIAALKAYRFSICYENMRDIKGYVTEKIFDCFAAGCVPIYWGASNIADYIPKACFIDRRNFGSFGEVYNYIRTMDKATYENYLKNIREFLQSDKAKLFSSEYFQITFLEAVRFP